MNYARENMARNSLGSEAGAIPSTQPDVPSAIGDLEMELTELQQALNVLHDRLCVVMPAEPPQAIEKDGTVVGQNGACAVSCAIRDQARRVSRARSRVINMIERLQV